MRESRPAVAVVVSHPIQHFCPFYRAIAADGRVALRVFFGSTAGLRSYFDKDFNKEVRWEQGLVSGFDHEFLPGAERTDLAKPISNRTLWGALSRFGPDAVVVYGFNHGLSRLALAWAKAHGRGVAYVADSEVRSRQPLRARLRKRATLPWLFRLVDGFLTVGDCNEAYYARYGVPASKLFRTPFTVNERALDEVYERRAEVRSRTRRELGIGEREVVGLVVGKLTVRKSPEHVVQALDWLDQQRHPAAERLSVAFAGDGPERGAVERAAAKRGPRVRALGFVEVERLPALLVAADLLVHPSSQDPHPLVTAEAAFAGLPLVVSDRVGSVGPTDDVRPGENGLEYPYADVPALAGALARMVTDDALRLRMAERSRSIAQERRIARSLSGFVECVNAVTATRDAR